MDDILNRLEKSLEQKVFRNTDKKFQNFTEDSSEFKIISKITNDILRKTDKQYKCYCKNKKFRGICARTTLVFMLVGSLVAAIIPLLAIIYIDSENNNQPLINLGWSAVATAFVATLCIFEKFYGSSKAWVRYSFVQLKLAQQYELLNYDWTVFQLRYGKGEYEKGAELWLDRLKEHLDCVFTIEFNETNEWSKDFSQVLQEINKLQTNKITK